MNTITAIRNRILQLCEERNLTINKLATISAISPSSLKSILYGNSNNPKILTLKMLCDGLDITLAEFFDTPEFNTLEQEMKYFKCNAFPISEKISQRSRTFYPFPSNIIHKIPSPSYICIETKCGFVWHFCKRRILDSE